MKETRNLLMTLFCIPIGYVAAVAIVFETNIFEPGYSAGDKNVEFVMTAIMELMTLGTVFLALRLFKFNKVHADLVTRKYSALKKWGVLRLLMLGLPMMYNTYLYYMFMNTTFGYMAIIQMLCMPFVYPSLNRCIAETTEEEK